jgi:hypothetical protein
MGRIYDSIKDIYMLFLKKINQLKLTYFTYSWNINLLDSWIKFNNKRRIEPTFVFGHVNLIATTKKF